MKKIYAPIFLLLILSSSIHAQNFNLTFRSEINYPYSCASIWGYVDDDQTEYALVGTYAGVSIVDVSAPDNPVVKFNVSHTPGEWREIKSYGHYAYATNEGGGGLLVIDLSDLPNSVQSYSFSYTDQLGQTQSNGHTLYIDEDGRLYIFGGNYGAGGATIFDLNVDPISPPFLGKYEQHYIHDGYVRGDTLWASEIYDGNLEMVNVSNPANCIPMASLTTPSAFTHNAWPTHDDHYVFTTDEVDNSFLTSYDVSDFSNITELDRVQSNPGSGVIIHNVHLYNDQFAVVAYYKDGVVLFDVSHPDNMIEVGSYDTDPGESGGSYGGTWGVYPFLPSGNIIASDLTDAGTQNGKLTVMTPTYVAACWLEGVVTDSITGTPINNTLVEVLSTTQSDNSDLSGVYKTGSGISGNYTVRYSAFGYNIKELQNVTLSSGVTNILNVTLSTLPTLAASGTIVDSLTNLPIPNAEVYIRGSNGLTMNVLTDGAGNFNISPLYEGTYDVFAGKWGYHENGLYGLTIDPNTLPIQLAISSGYYDDFILDEGWSVNSTATTGVWERGEPIGTDNGTPYNPDFDATGDWGDFCYVTGNGGGAITYDDVDSGKTTLSSPMMDLSAYEDPIVSFSSWFADGEGNGNPNDTLKVFINDGINNMLIANIKFPTSLWVNHQYHLNDFLDPNATMQISFEVSDLAQSGHVVEGAIDKFKISDSHSTGITAIEPNLNCGLYPNPFADYTYVHYSFSEASVTNPRMDIYNILGELVETHLLQTSDGTVIWGNHLNYGFYTVKFVNNTKVLKVMTAVKLK